jgi:hypothetical protein
MRERKYFAGLIFTLLVLVGLGAILGWVNPFLSVSGYDKERANQHLRIKAGNDNYRRELEVQLASERDPERKKLLLMEYERLTP